MFEPKHRKKIKLKIKRRREKRRRCKQGRMYLQHREKKGNQEREKEKENGVRATSEISFVLRRCCNGVVCWSLHPPSRLQTCSPIPHSTGIFQQHLC